MKCIGEIVQDVDGGPWAKPKGHELMYILSQQRVVLSGVEGW